MHLEISGSKQKGLTYMQVRYNDQVFASVQGAFIPIQQRELYVGNNANIEGKGLRGKVRELVVARFFVS